MEGNRNSLCQFDIFGINYSFDEGVEDPEKYSESLDIRKGNECTGWKYCNVKHEDQYDVLVKAWKEGKVILKEYGEK